MKNWLVCEVTVKCSEKKKKDATAETKRTNRKKMFCALKFHIVKGCTCIVQYQNISI